MAEEREDKVEECVTRLLAARFKGGSVVLIDPDSETRDELGEAFEEVGLAVLTVDKPSDIPAALGSGDTPSMLLAPYWLHREVQRLRDLHQWSSELIFYESAGVSTPGVGFA